MRLWIFKYLRIAITAVSLFVCAVLLVLWIRSYAQPEVIVAPLFQLPPIDMRNQDGMVLLALSRIPTDDGWVVAQIVGEKAVFKSPWSLYSDQRTYIATSAPHWFYLTIFATIAAVPWIKWRFSLRTLLIVITLFAMFFAAIAMSM